MLHMALFIIIIILFFTLFIFIISGRMRHGTHLKKSNTTRQTGASDSHRKATNSQIWIPDTGTGIGTDTDASASFGARNYAAFKHLRFVLNKSNHMPQKY